MDELTDLPNVGKVLERKLKQCGITTPEELRNAGSKNTFLRLKAFDDTACFSMLQAIEGAIQNVRWHDLPEKSKHDLKEFFMLTKAK
jgi:DNA transformation protein